MEQIIKKSVSLGLSPAYDAPKGPETLQVCPPDAGSFMAIHLSIF